MRFKLIPIASITLITSLLFFGCSQNRKDDFKTHIARFLWSSAISEQPIIKVLNQYGEPLAQAQILVGLNEGSPFKGNYLITDNLGTAKVPNAWSTPEHVTVDATGYIRQTLLNQNPGDITIKMNSAYLTSPAEVKGAVTSLPIVNGDKMIDFALVMSAMTKADLLNFDLNALISPYSDAFTIAGQKADVPSNISLPTQKESYFFNLTISKPIYRMVTPTLGPKRFFAVRGQFLFKAVIDELRSGKQFYELLNYFSIQGGGMRDVTLLNSKTNLDIPGNELSFNSKLKVQPASANADEVLILVAVSDIANSLVPTDIKRVTNNGSASLTSLANKPAYVVQVIKKQAELNANKTNSDRTSVAISPYSENTKMDLLPLVDNPSMTNSNGFLITLPALPLKAGIHGLAVSAIISDLSEIQNGTDKVTHINRRWEIIGLGWSEKIQLPNWPLTNRTAKTRLEINYLGSTSEQIAPLEGIIDAATHVTHASVDF